MNTKMQRYVEQLEKKGIVPGNQLRETVQQMKNIEELFEGKVREISISVATKDIPRLEQAIADTETAVQNAKELLERVKSYAANN